MVWHSLENPDKSRRNDDLLILDSNLHLLTPSEDPEPAQNRQLLIVRLEIRLHPPLVLRRLSIGWEPFLQVLAGHYGVPQDVLHLLRFNRGNRLVEKRLGSRAVHHLAKTGGVPDVSQEVVRRIIGIDKHVVASSNFVAQQESERWIVLWQYDRSAPRQDVLVCGGRVECAIRRDEYESDGDHDGNDNLHDPPPVNGVPEQPQRNQQDGTSVDQMHHVSSVEFRKPQCEPDQTIRDDRRAEHLGSRRGEDAHTDKRNHQKRQRRDQQKGKHQNDRACKRHGRRKQLQRCNAKRIQHQEVGIRKSIGVDVCVERRANGGVDEIVEGAEPEEPGKHHQAYDAVARKYRTNITH